MLHHVTHHVTHFAKHTVMHVIVPNVLRLIVLPAGCMLLGLFGLHVSPDEAFGALTGETHKVTEHVPDLARSCSEWIHLA